MFISSIASQSNSKNRGETEAWRADIKAVCESRDLNSGLSGSEKHALSPGFGCSPNSYLVLASTWPHYTTANLGNHRLHREAQFSALHRVSHAREGPDGYEKGWGGDQGGEQKEAQRQHMWALEETMGHKCQVPSGERAGEQHDNTHTFHRTHTYMPVHGDHGTPSPKCTYPVVCGGCCTCGF